VGEVMVAKVMWAEVTVAGAVASMIGLMALRGVRGVRWVRQGASARIRVRQGASDLVAQGG
jgi:hypothetical protein